MTRKILLVPALALACIVLCSAVSDGAAKAGNDAKQSKKEQKLEARLAKIPGPLGQIDLTTDQFAKISDIQKLAQTQIKAIHDKEQTDIRALLTDEQRTKYDQLMAQAQSESKTMREAQRNKKTTDGAAPTADQPAGDAPATVAPDAAAK